MQYNRLGNSGLIVSRMAFGVMTFGQSEGLFKSISKVGQDLANDLVAKVLDAGVNFFNTADVYTEGQSETMLGKALGSRRKDAIIATKAGFRTSPALADQGLSRHHILAAADASLKRMGTDYIDVYLVHRVDPHTPIEETVEALDALVRSGKVRYVGYSNWPAWMSAKARGIQEQRGLAPFKAAEMYYSLVGRDLEHEIVPFTQDAGIGIMVWSPLAGGLLSGKYTRENPAGDGGRLSAFNMLPHDPEHGHKVVDHLRTVAKSRGVTPAQVALAWVLSKPFVSSVLMGSNKMSQLEDNLAAANLQLSADELAELDRLTAPPLQYPGWFMKRVVDDTVEKALKAGA
jgi:aryl-alcohol dehydrogenase-like predicted oxidoreductase